MLKRGSWRLAKWYGVAGLAMAASCHGVSQRKYGENLFS
jgi:hypothetical protein